MQILVTIPKLDTEMLQDSGWGQFRSTPTPPSLPGVG